MPLQKLQFRPGVNREGTTLANEGGWYDCDKVRFRSGYPEKIGGWSVESYATFLGLCRSLWNWITLKGYNLLGVGTNAKFYVESGGVYYDITPLRTPTSTNSVTFAADISAPFSAFITVTDSSAFSLQAGDFVTFSQAVSLGGNITATILNQEYQIQTVLSGTSYTIVARAAGASVNGVNFTVNTTTSTLSFPVGTTLTNGATVTLIIGAGAPGGLNYTTAYYVVNASGSTCQLALTSGGTPITLTSQGIGLQSFYFTVESNASDSNNGGGATDAAYQINTGYPIYTIGTGWGTGPWVPYATTTLTNPFATTSGINTITVTHNSHGLTTGQYVYFQSISDADVSGIPNTVLQIGFQVTVTGVNSYTISTVIGQAPGPVLTYTPNATSGSEGGTVVVNYPSSTVPGSSRSWGSGTSTGFGLQLRLWSQSNFGEDILFNPRGGSIYYWAPGAGATPAFNAPGTVVSGTYTPSLVNEIMVSDSSRIVIAFGCNDPSGTYGPTALDPMLIRWTDQESYTQWQPQTTNQAGDYRLSHGSEIVAALQTRQEINVWTDAAIYAMQYLGPPFVWGFTLLADNISIASPNAMATASGVVYWMGVDKFYVYSGRVETLPCSVRTYIYDDINRDQFAQIYAGTNEGYSEVWWFYCSANSNIVDRYVIFNYLDRVWYYGTMSRTAWLDSPLRQFPVATTGNNNLLVYHESAVDDGSTNPPSPINTYIQSSDFDIGDGHNYGFVWRVIPDITFNGSNTSGTTTINPAVNFTVRPRQNPGSAYSVSNSPAVQSAASQTYKTTTTYNVQEFTEIVYTRIRGRQMAFRVSSDTAGTQWQLGVPRLDVRPDGRR
jgi:hypothetical protein